MMDITTLPYRAEPLFLGVLAVTVLLWIALSLYVVLNRRAHDRRQRRLMEAARDLSDPAVASLPPLERSPAIRRMMSRLSRRELYLMVASTELPPGVSEICAAYATDRVGLDRIADDACVDAERRKWRRIPALFALGKLKAPKAYEVLETAITDPDPDVSNAASVILHRMGDRHAAAILIAALRKGSPPPSRVATHLDQFPLAIHDLIRPVLVDPQPHARQWAASLLARYPDVPGLAVEVAELADDRDPQVRKAALATLGAMTNPVAVPTAQRRLGDPVSYVRSTAIRVLTRHGSVDADEARRQTIASWIAPGLADGTWDVRTAAKESLVQLGPATWRNVAAQLRSPDEFARNSAAEVLQNLGLVDSTIKGFGSGVEPATDAVDAVTRALHAGGPPMARAAAMRSTPESLPVIEGLVASPQLAGVEP